MKPILAFLLLAASTLAAEPVAVITGPAEVPAGTSIVEFRTTGAAADDGALAWALPFDPANVVDYVDRLSGEPRLKIVAPPKGVWRLTLTAAGVVDGKVKLSVATHVLTVGEGPEPGPKPDPDPDPKPEPITGPFWIYVIEESAQRTPDTAILMADKSFWDGLSAKGHKWRVYDDDSKDAQQLAQLTTHRPALVVQAMSGEVLKVVQLKNKATVEATLKEIESP